MQIKSLGFHNIQNACVVIVCAWVLVPQLTISEAARLAVLVSVALWLLIEFIRAPGVFQSPTLPVVLLLIFTSYTALMEYFFHDVSGLINRVQLYIMLFFLIVHQSRRRNPETLYTTFWIVVCLNIVALTTTYFFLSSVDARAMRTVVRSSAAASELLEQGVGGYGMAYGAALMLPALLALSLRPALIYRLNPPRVLFLFPLMPALIIWCLTGLSAIVIMSSQFAIAVFVTAFSVISVLLLWSFSVSRLFFLAVMGLFLALFGEMILTQILETLLSYAEGTNYVVKINDLLVTLRSDDLTGSAELREERYTRSMELFFGHPLTGVIEFTDLGKHSMLLDGFARWGILFGGILLYLVCFLELRALKRLRWTPGGFGASFGTLMAILLIFGLNNSFMHAGIAIYLISPLILSVFDPARVRRAKPIGDGPYVTSSSCRGAMDWTRDPPLRYSPWCSRR